MAELELILPRLSIRLLTPQIVFRHTTTLYLIITSPVPLGYQARVYIYIVDYKTRTEVKATAVCLNDYNPLLGNAKKNSDHVENSFHNLLNLTKIHFNLSRI